MTTLEGQQGTQKVGRFSVELELSNHEDVILAKNGVIPAAKIRRVTLLGLVDTGASRLVLPQRVVKQLGLEPSGTVKVKYADGRQVVRPTVDDVEVELLGRRNVFSASEMIIFGSRGTSFIFNGSTKKSKSSRIKAPIRAVCRRGSTDAENTLRRPRSLTSTSSTVGRTT